MLEDAVLGLLVKKEGESAQARLVRTSPPDYGSGVAQIAYSGSYPVSRLRIIDDSLEMPTSVYGFSTHKPTDVQFSAIPAVVFTLVVENVQGDTPAQASFFFNLPLGAIKHCARISSSSGVVVQSQPDYATCLHSCAAAGTSCSSWFYDGTLCHMNPDLPHSVYHHDGYCGVSGHWSASGSDLTLLTSPPEA